MILRRIVAAVALLCAFALPSYAQTGSPKTAAQLNAEINSLYPDQNQGAITPFAIRQVSLDQVASGVLGVITLSGPITGSGTNSIVTTLGIGAVDTTNLNADVFSTARSWSGLQTFAGGVTGLPAPVNPTDAATKQYVDGVAQGIIVLAPSGLATAAVLPNTPTYNNGTAGVGATLTAGSNTTLTVDGTAALLNTVVLVKNQASAFQNGIYTVTQAGSGSVPWVLTRATYFDIASQMKAGSYTFVSGGATNIGSSFALATAVTTVGTDPLNWNLFASSGGTVTNAQLVPGAANTFKGSLSGSATSDIALTACTLSYQITKWVSGTGWQCGLNPVLPSRSIAATLNLSAFTAITTQGYSTPGDGGTATFVNIGTSASFLDSTPTFTLSNAGTGCTPTTFSQYLTVSSNALANGTVGRFTVGGGGTITASNISTPGVGFNVGDTVTFASGFIAGCSVLPIFTVSSVTTPTGSFTDTAGNRWQIQLRPDSGISILAFGAKNDWTVTAGDAGSTNNTTAIQNALWFAYGQGQNIASGQLGATGAIVNVPPKTTMACALNLPYGVTLQMAGRYSSVLKDCDAELAANHFITVGDPNLQLSCFGSMIRDGTISPGAQTNGANSGTAIVFSNCIQQQTYMDRVQMGAGARSCASLQIGWGGAEGVGMRDIECIMSGTTNPGFNISYGVATIVMDHINTEAGGSLANVGISVASGSINLHTFHVEGVQTGIFLNVPSNNGISSFHHLIGGANCTNLVTRQSGSAANVNVIGMAQPNGCTNTLNNAGAANTSNIIADAVF